MFGGTRTIRQPHWSCGCRESEPGLGLCGSPDERRKGPHRRRPDPAPRPSHVSRTPIPSPMLT